LVEIVRAGPSGKSFSNPFNLLHGRLLKSAGRRKGTHT
jgi:hypothetical protein